MGVSQITLETSRTGGYQWIGRVVQHREAGTTMGDINYIGSTEIIRVLLMNGVYKFSQNSMGMIVSTVIWLTPIPHLVLWPHSSKWRLPPKKNRREWAQLVFEMSHNIRYYLFVIILTIPGAWLVPPVVNFHPDHHKHKPSIYITALIGTLSWNQPPARLHYARGLV